MKDFSSMSVKEVKAAVVAAIGEKGLAQRNFTEKSEMIKFLEEKEEADRNRKLGVSIVPAGKYIVGDPCYVANDVCDLETFNETYYDHEDPFSVAVATGEPRFNDKTPVVAFNTAELQPAWYTDNSKLHSFLVNGGVLALVPLSYNPSFEDIPEAHIVEFSATTKCFASKGVIHFGDIVINTNKKSKKKPAAKRKLDKYEDVADSDEEEEAPEEEEEEEWEDSEDDDNYGNDGDDGSGNEEEAPPAGSKRRRLEVEDTDSGDDI
jgi:hypothetical protein